jgi:hypothetical protein
MFNEGLWCVLTTKCGKWFYWAEKYEKMNPNNPL